MAMVKIGYYLEIVGSLFSSSVVVPDNHLLSLLLFTNSLGFFLLASTSPLTVHVHPFSQFYHDYKFKDFRFTAIP